MTKSIIIEVTASEQIIANLEQSRDFAIAKSERMTDLKGLVLDNIDRINSDDKEIIEEMKLLVKSVRSFKTLVSAIKQLLESIEVVEEEQPLQRDDVHQGQDWDTHKIVTTMCDGYVVNLSTIQARNLLSLASRMINKGDTSADWHIVASQALNLA